MKYVITGLALALMLSASAFAGTQALIGSAQIANRSIRLIDIHPSAVKALRGKRGPRGLRGLQGPPGLAGAQGPAGANGGFDPSKVSYVTGPTRSFPPYPDPNYIGFVEAACPPGTKVIGGGYFANILHVAADKTYDGNKWSVLINNDTSITVEANAHAICASP